MKTKKLFTLCLLSSVLLTGCNDLPENSYRVEDKKIRTIESFEKKEEIKDFQLDSFMVVYDQIGTVKVNIETGFVPGTIFFKGTDYGKINEKGYDVVYSSFLKEVAHGATSDTVYCCSVTGLYTYNSKVSVPCVTTDFDTTKYPAKSVVGEVGTVDKYNLTYTDYNSKKEKIAEGSFDLFVLKDTALVSIFVPYQFQE